MKCNTNGRGIDISSKRLSKLSKIFFDFLIHNKNKGNIIDLGSGSGIVGITASMLHYNVFLYDIYINNNIKTLTKNLQLIFGLKLTQYELDLSQISYNDLPTDIVGIYAGYFLHYLNYQDAQKLLKILYKRTLKKGKFFVIVSGIKSELSHQYLHRDVNNRFAHLSIENQKKFHIKEKVVLYNENELEKLFEDSGWTMEYIETSQFGNVLGIFIKN